MHKICEKSVRKCLECFWMSSKILRAVVEMIQKTAFARAEWQGLTTFYGLHEKTRISPGIEMPKPEA